MNPWTARLLWALATVTLAGTTAVFVSHSMRNKGTAAMPGSEADFHRWMHEQLAITPVQHEALAAVEAGYEKEREELRGEISEAGKQLADAVRKGNAGSPEIEAALQRLNAAQGKLQRATLTHFFAMKDHLDPAQAEKLLQWTHDSILPK